MPRQMRPAGVRANDTRLAPSERARAYGEVQRSLAPLPGERAPQSNQFAEAGQMALESTGLPSIRRGSGALTRSIVNNRPQEALPALGEIGLGALGVAGMASFAPRAPRMAPRMAPPRPAVQPTRIYRGLNQEHDPQRAALLGDRWWHTSPEVASTYAPGLEGAHVMPGVVDEGALRLARIQAPPGTTSRHIPVDALPPDVRRAFPRSRTHVTSHEVAAAAESVGYEGVTFGGIRDSGYAGAMEGPYPGFGTGDDGRVFALFRDDAVRSPFEPRGGALRAPQGAPQPQGLLSRGPAPPPREIGANGMPIAPRQPFRNSLRGGSDDLTEAARAMPRAPDAGRGGAEQFDTSRVVYRGLNRPYDAADGGYYQSFTSSIDDAREYGSHVMAAHLRPGRNLAVDGGGNNFNALSVEQLPADVRARLHPSVGASATTDQIAHAAREAGYDSLTVRNVHDNRWGERPTGGEPRTIDFIFDTRNISPLDNLPPQAATSRPAAKVRLSDSDRALLAELEADLPAPRAPDGGNAGAGGYRIDKYGSLTYDRPTSPPARLFHGTTSDVDEFAPGSHFGTAEAANRRLADNAPRAAGARIYRIEPPPGEYVRVSDAGDAWDKGSHWAEVARTRSPRSDAEAALYRALRRDEDLSELRGEQLYARLDQHFRDNGFVGALYANRFEGGESVFLPGRTPNAPAVGPPDTSKANRSSKPLFGAAFSLPRRR